MSEINLQNYKTFISAARTDSFSEAAEQLMISQPAVSQTIRQLENQLDTKLFNRKGKSGRLTETGQMLYERMAPLLEKIYQVENQILRMKETKSGTLKIRASNQAWKHYLIPHLKSFKDHYPDIKIQLETETTLKTLKAIEQNLCDCALVMLPSRQLNRPIQTTILKQVPVRFYTSPAFMDPRTKEYSIREISNSPFILPDKTTATRKMLDKIFHQQGFQPRNELECSSISILIETVKEGMGIAPLASDYIKAELKSGELYEIRIKNINAHLTLALAISPASANPGAIEVFTQFIQKRIQNMPQ